MEESCSDESNQPDKIIAKAMGWREVPPINYLADTQWYHKGTYHKHPPRFHESHDARAALLEWIRTQGKLTMRRFLSILHGTLSDTLRFTDRPEYMIVEMMCATPAQVAEAALKVIKETE